MLVNYITHVSELWIEVLRTTLEFLDHVTKCHKNVCNSSRNFCNNPIEFKQDAHI